MQPKKNRIASKAILAASLALSMFAGVSATVSASPVATATVNKSVNFRTAQSTSATVLGLIKAGTTLQVEAANDYWVLVDYNGKTGYVSRSYVTIHGSGSPTQPPANPGNGSASGIINTAKSLQGKVRYVFGARDQSRLIFDCSSYTQYVFQLNGKSIPWGSKAQASVGKSVAKSQLQAGDLVFFSVSTPGQINHVGIYIGNGQFINNLPNEGVVISDLGSSYWTSHYIKARRV